MTRPHRGQALSLRLPFSQFLLERLDTLGKGELGLLTYADVPSGAGSF